METFTVDVDDPAPLDGSWETYRKYFFETHLSGLSVSYEDSMGPILNRFEDFAKPRFLTEVTASTARRWIASLRKDGLAVASVKTYWRHVSAFLSLAVEDGLLNHTPKIRLPKTDSKSLSKGRPLVLEEFERLKKAVKNVKKKHFKQWEFFIDGLWLSGLRIGEAHRLTWTESGFYVDMNRVRPCFVISEQKNKDRQLLPMVPDFALHLRKVSANRRNGFVFDLEKENGAGRVVLSTAEKAISKCGEKASIKVGQGKTASAHDLRRSFATRWAVKVLPQVLQKLMRHREIATTLKYYANVDVDTLADQIYDAVDDAKSPTVGKTMGNSHE